MLVKSVSKKNKKAIIFPSTLLILSFHSLTVQIKPYFHKGFLFWTPSPLIVKPFTPSIINRTPSHGHRLTTVLVAPSSLPVVVALSSLPVVVTRFTLVVEPYQFTFVVAPSSVLFVAAPSSVHFHRRAVIGVSMFSGMLHFQIYFSFQFQ